MSFEEELNKILEADDLAYEHIINIKNEFCLDHQKVREAIENVWIKRQQTTDKILWQSKFKAELLKELGLDKNDENDKRRKNEIN